jgi:hypothetical protein
VTILYCFNEPVYDGVTLIGNEVVEMTREEVLESAWAVHWKDRMEEKYGIGHSLINDSQCLDDFLMVYWGWCRVTCDD